MAFVSGTAALYIVVFVLIGFTTVHPLAPILLSSFALTSNALTFIAAIPVLVGDDRYLGTAFGIWKAFVRHVYPSSRDRVTYKLINCSKTATRPY
jgi:hypothetical protein